jgi:hypothetical protein
MPCLLKLVPSIGLWNFFIVWYGNSKGLPVTVTHEKNKVLHFSFLWQFIFYANLMLSRKKLPPTGRQYCSKVKFVNIV